MKTIEERLALLDKVLANETPESLYAKLASYEGIKSLSTIETEQQRFNICFEHAHWDQGQLIERRIVSAANRYKLKDGGLIVIPGTRHSSKDMAAVVRLVEDKLASRHTEDQGFVDQFANYWSREEALIIATHAGQINTVRMKSSPKHMLFSEDLY